MRWLILLLFFAYCGCMTCKLGQHIDYGPYGEPSIIGGMRGNGARCMADCYPDCPDHGLCEGHWCWVDPPHGGWTWKCDAEQDGGR